MCGGGKTHTLVCLSYTHTLTHSLTHSHPTPVPCSADVRRDKTDAAEGT